MTVDRYSELLKHPKWQEKRLRVFDRANFKCRRCGSGERSLHAHHKIYFRGHKPWEYEDDLLECLCEPCHQAAHEAKQELDLIVAREPTSKLAMFTDAITAALTNDAPDPSLPPRVRAVFRRLGQALNGSDATELINANNELQDLIDEFLDFRRGPGGQQAAA